MFVFETNRFLIWLKSNSQRSTSAFPVGTKNSNIAVLGFAALNKVHIQRQIGFSFGSNQAHSVPPVYFPQARRTTTQQFGTNKKSYREITRDNLIQNYFSISVAGITIPRYNQVVNK